MEAVPAEMPFGRALCTSTDYWDTEITALAKPGLCQKTRVKLLIEKTRPDMASSNNASLLLQEVQVFGQRTPKVGPSPFRASFP